MKQRKRVIKRAKVSRKAKRTRAPEKVRRPRYLPDELAGMYRPVKKPVTLRLDADILEWFQRDGKGYQTRINRALRQVMIAQRKRSRE